MFEHRLHLSKIGHTFLNGVSLSDLIWTYVVAGAYCLVQGRVWRFHQRNKAYLSPSISLIKLITQVGNHTPNCLDSLSSVVKMSAVESNRTVAHDVICYSLRGVMDICRYSPHPKTNALIDCIYHSQAHCRFTPPGIQGRMGSLPRACSGTGWLSSKWSPLCRDHARAAL